MIARSASLAAAVALIAAAPASAASQFTKPVTAFTTEGEITYLTASGSPEGGTAITAGYNPGRGGNILFHTRVRPDGRVDGVTETRTRNAFQSMGAVISGVRVARGWRMFRTDITGTEPLRWDLVEIAKNGKVRGRKRLPGSSQPTMVFNGVGHMILKTEKWATFTVNTGKPRKIDPPPDVDDTETRPHLFDDGRAYIAYEYTRGDAGRLHASRLNSRSGKWTKPQELFRSPEVGKTSLEGSAMYSNRPGEVLIRYTVDPTPSETGGYQRFVRWSTRGRAFGSPSELPRAGQVPTAGGALKGDGYLLGDVTDDGAFHAIYSPGAGTPFTDRWQYAIPLPRGSVIDTLMEDGRTVLSWTTRGGETTSIHAVVVSATGKAGAVHTLATLPERTRLVDRSQTLLGSGTVVLAWTEARDGPDQNGGARGPLIDSSVRVAALRP